MSRYQWPEDKKTRLAQIIINLRVWIPPGKKKPRSKPTKDDLEEEDEKEEGKEE